MLELLIYFVSLLIFFAINLRVLRAINLPSIFKKNHIWEIKVAYFLIALALAHLLTEVILRFSQWVNILN